MMNTTIMGPGTIGRGHITTTSPYTIANPLSHGDQSEDYLAGTTRKFDPASLGIGVLLAIGLLVYVASEGTKSMEKNPEMTREELAQRASALVSRYGHAPGISADSSRGDLIAWLSWNDPNGCYSDSDCEIEGFDPLTVDEAWEIIASQLEG